MNEINNENLAIIAALDHQKRTLFRSQFLKLHFYDQTQLFASFTAKQRSRIYQFLTPKELGDMFDEFEVEETTVIGFLKEMEPQLAADILSEMYTDNTVDILGQMDKADLATYLNLMPADEIVEVRQLLNYQDKTAGALMTTEYVAIDQHKTVSTAMQIIRHQATNAEIIYYLYVLDDAQNLIGVVTLRDLMVSDKRAVIQTIMNPHVYSVFVDDDQENIAQKVREYDFLAVPVVSRTGHMLGIITIDDIIDVIDEESAEDYSGLAGVNVDDTRETPWRAAIHRLPWLITLLILGMSTAGLINHFDSLVSQASILAVFISLITGTAGNAGTQSLAIAIRKISVENDRKIWHLISNEVLTGVIIGFTSALVITLIVGFWKSNFILGGVIGISMMAAIVVANLAGSLIPILMDWIGVDPAVASGPFISTLSDLTSVMIYFSVAQLFLAYLT